VCEEKRCTGSIKKTVAQTLEIKSFLKLTIPLLTFWSLQLSVKENCYERRNMSFPGCYRVYLVADS